MLTLIALCPVLVQEPRLQIDPLLLHQVAEVFQIIAAPDNPVWPGWDASDTPTLLYLPGVQDLLINHPSPPAGFTPFETSLLPAGWSAHLRDGETILDLDGQNTSRMIGGVQTLVVADPISNLRPNLKQILRGSEDVDKRLTVDLLSADPYEQLAFVVHEAFHVHQYREAEDKLANEAFLLDYPWLSAELNVGWALEGRALVDGLRAKDSGTLREAVQRWLAVRDARRAPLGPDAIAYEDGNEFGEGLAKYAEWKLCQVLEGREPGAAMGWARGFHGYEDLSFWRARLIDGVARATSGEMVVNGDPYGSGNLRFRLYYTGMAIAALLDALEVPNWQARILEPDTTLTGLLRGALAADAQNLTAALERARSIPELAQLQQDKADLERDGRAAAEAMVAAVLGGEALFTLDYSAFEEAEPSFSYTPFGLSRAGEARMLYTMVPIGASVAGARVDQGVASTLLHDRGARTIQFQLRRVLDRAALLADLGLERLPADALVDLNLALPGASLQAPRARLAFEGGGLRVVLLPTKD
jgi:hypothetical protein